VLREDRGLSREIHRVGRVLRRGGRGLRRGGRGLCRGPGPLAASRDGGGSARGKRRQRLRREYRDDGEDRDEDEDPDEGQTRNEMKVFLGRVATGYNPGHIGAARVWVCNKYSWTTARSYGTCRGSMGDGEAVGNINNIET
jgi:hypothetical protein